MTSADYVREHYQVPAKKGMRVTMDGRPGVITGFVSAYVRVRFDGDKRSTACHPTWRMDYAPAATEATR